MLLNIDKPVCGVRNSADLNIDDMIGLMQCESFIGIGISNTLFIPMTYKNCTDISRRYMT